MRKKLLIGTLSMLAIAAIIWASLPTRSGKMLHAETRRILEAGDFELLSLYPYAIQDSERASLGDQEEFHYFRVLGKTKITDRAERQQLLAALYESIEDASSFYSCFNPRHGIRATLGGETVDLVICFECLQMEVHSQRDKSTRITEAPAEKFTAALKKAGVTVHPRK